MGVWEGIFKGGEAADAKKERDRDFALKTKMFDEKRRMGRLDSLSKYVSTYQNESGGSSFTGTGKKVASLQGSEHYISILSDMGIDQDAIARVAGTGARNLQSVTKLLSNAQASHISEYGTNVEPPLEQYNLALENAVLTQPSGPKIDMDKVAEMFDIQLSKSELAIITPGARAPALTIRSGDLNIVPALSFKDLPAATKAVGMEVILNAQRELKKYQDTIGQSPSGDTEVNKWLTARVGQIQSGISNATGDIPILTDLFDLFGNSYASQYIESQPVLNNAVKMGQFPKSYAEAAARPDIDLTVPITGIGNLSEHGAKIYNYLMQNNLVPIGTKIKFLKTNGTEYNMLVTQELLEEFNR